MVFGQKREGKKAADHQPYRDDKHNFSTAVMKNPQDEFYNVLLHAWQSRGPGSMNRQVYGSIKTRTHHGIDNTKAEIHIFLN